MGTFIIILSLVAPISFGAIIDSRTRKRMQRYWDRACTGSQWRRRFPEASKSEIRSFLDLFLDAFAFSQNRRLCFSPDDKIMEIYHVLYSDCVADSMELEDLALELRKKYGIDAISFWREDITLGEIFTHTRAV